MARKWNILMIGTRIRVKGDKDIDGHIINWLTDDEKVITGYLFKSDDDPPIFMPLLLDDKDDIFEVLG